MLGVGTSEGGPIRQGKGFATDAAGRRVVARLDRDGLEALARDAGVFVATATRDARDVDRLQARIQSHLEAVQAADPKARWKDAGYWLTLPFALLGALWFRRGWTVRWTAVLVFGLGFGAPRGPRSPSRRPRRRGPPRRDGASRTSGSRGTSRDAWPTSGGDFAGAAALFRDPMWKGLAASRAGDWDAAVDAFARLESPEALFDLGNAYAHRGDLPLAVQAYEQALALRPGWREARENRDRVAALIPKPKKDDEEGRRRRRTSSPTR